MSIRVKLIFTSVIVGVLTIFILVITSDTFKFAKQRILTDISPEFSNFTDMYGNMVSYADLPKKRTLIAFGYTTCIDICPVTMANLTNILYDIEDTYGAAEVEKFQVLYFSVDPDRDTPQVLYDVIHDVYHPKILGLVGTPEQTTKLSAQFQVTYRKSQDDIKYYTVIHTADIFLFDENGTYQTQFAHTAPPRVILPLIYKYFKEANRL